MTNEHDAAFQRWFNDAMLTRLSPRPTPPAAAHTADDVRRRLALKPTSADRHSAEGNETVLRRLCQALAHAANGLNVAWVTRGHQACDQASAELRRMALDAGLALDPTKCRPAVLGFASKGVIYFLCPSRPTSGLRIDHIIQG